MKQYLLSVFSFLMLGPLSLSAQSFEIWNEDNTENLTNGSLTVIVPVGYELHDYHFNVIETAGVAGVSYSARRYELEYVPSTFEYFCWSLCLPPLEAGTTYLREMPSGSFFVSEANAPMPQGGGFPTMYFNPQFETTGTATYRVEVFDVDDEENSAYVDITWVIDPDLTSVDEYADLSSSLSPNPASGIAALSIAGVEDMLSVQVMDLLGQEISNELFNPAAADRYLIDTEGMQNGIYLVAIRSEEEVLKTIKLVVKH